MINNEYAISLKKIETFKNSIKDFNKYLDVMANEMLLVYDGNPYCHEYALNLKLYQENNKMLKVLDDYAKVYTEYREWVKDGNKKIK